MTQVGKILVLVIMAFSLVFLGIATMVFVTSKNWKDATAKKDTEVKKVRTELQTAQASVDAAKKTLEENQARAQQETKGLETRIRTLEDQNKRDLTEITKVREELAVQLATNARARTRKKRPGATRPCCCGSRNRPWRSRPTSTSSARPT